MDPECDKPIHTKFKSREKRVSTIGELLLLGFKGRCKVKGVKDPTRVTDFIRRQAVLLEDRVLVDTSWVLDVLPSPYLHIVEQYELNHKQCRWWGKVLCLPCIIPFRNVDDPELCKHLWKQHSGHSEHRPSAIHQLRLHVPPQVLWVLCQSQGIKPIVSWEADPLWHVKVRHFSKTPCWNSAIKLSKILCSSLILWLLCLACLVDWVLSNLN